MGFLSHLLTSLFATRSIAFGYGGKLANYHDASSVFFSGRFYDIKIVCSRARGRFKNVMVPGEGFETIRL